MCVCVCPLPTLVNPSETPQNTELCGKAAHVNMKPGIENVQYSIPGSRKVRLPLTWAAFADALAPLDEVTCRFTDLQGGVPGGGGGCRGESM